MELLTATHSGVGLFIDELGGNTEPLLVYNLTSGRGKQRMAEGGGLRAQLRWSLFVLSSGELALADKIETTSGQRAKTGEIIRALDIAVDDLADPAGLGDEEAGRLVQHIKQQCGEVYGTAGPAFVQGVLDFFASEEALRQRLREDVAEHHDVLCAVARAAGYRVQAPHRRALRRLALVRTVGVWGAELLGLTEADATRAVDAAATAWLGALPPLSEGERIAARLRDYLDRHAADILDADAYPEDAPAPELADLRAIRHQDWILFTADSFAEACGETPPRVAAKALAALRLLHREADKLTSRHTLGRLHLPRAAYYAAIAKRLLPDSDMDGAGGPAPEAVPGQGDPEPNDG
jgi:hypothetical protein